MRQRAVPIEGPASVYDAPAGFAGKTGFAEAAGVDEPVDFAAVQADDELITALAAGMFDSTPGLDDQHHTYYDGDDRVVAMLAAWKAGIDAEPLLPLLDAAAPAATTVAVSPPVGGPARRYLMPIAGAAALVVFAIAGVSVGARSAQPGDTLWGVSKVLYREHAHSVEAAAAVAGRLEQVRTALASGHTELAAQELAATAPLLAAVAPEDGVSQLVQQQQFLVAKMSETPPNTATDLNAPLRNGQAAPPISSTGRTPAGNPDSSAAPEPSLPESSAPGLSLPGLSLPGSSLPGLLTAPGTKPSPPPPAAVADPPNLRAPLPPPVPIPVPPVPVPVLSVPAMPAPVLPVPDPQTTTVSPRPTTEGTPTTSTPHPTPSTNPRPAGNPTGTTAPTIPAG